MTAPSVAEGDSGKSAAGTDANAAERAWSELLRQIIELSTEERNLRQVLRRVAEFVVATTRADVCFVHLVDAEAGEIVLMGATPEQFDALAGTVRLDIGQGVAGWVAQFAKPAVVRDKWSDPRYVYIPALKGEEFNSMISVPLLRPGGVVVGVLNVHSRNADHFPPGDAARLGEVANLLAGIVENAVLYDRLANREAEVERFAAKTIELQELDRRRIAADIHDGITQRLVSAWYHLRAARALLLASGAGPGPASASPAIPGPASASPALEAQAPTTQAGSGPTSASPAGLGSASASPAGSDPAASASGVTAWQAGHQEAIAAEIETTEVLLSDALDEARHAISGLRPTILDDLGLTAGLTSLATSLGTEAEIELDLALCVLPAHVETALFRITQEALQNVMKHAQAQHVRIGLQETADGGTILAISDDGVGFEPLQPHGSISYGLQGMHERAALIGAQLEVRSRLGDGSSIIVTVPPRTDADPVDPDDATEGPRPEPAA